MKAHAFTTVLFSALLFASSGSRSLAETHTVNASNTVPDAPFLLATGPDVPSVNTQELEVAPVNPDFIEFMERDRKITAVDEDEGAFGWIPAPVSITDSLGENRRVVRTLMSAPSAYDLRSLGRVTSVKNQKSWGTCWAFGTYSSMESCLLPGEARDFSEKNLTNLHGFDYGCNTGGNGFMSMAYMLRWGGPVNESDDPYPSGSWSGSSSGLTVQKHAQQVHIIPGKADATDNAAIKQAIMDHGAVLATYCHSYRYYNSTHSTYYFYGSASANHAAAIVGWDDNFDRTKFGTVAPANGAYIVKNSWGTGWGDSGYYYVSYYDTSFAHGDMWCFFNTESTDNYNTLYMYDPLGWITSVNAPWAAAIYTAASTETLHAVGFYSDTGTTSYELYVYTGVSADAPRSGTLACSMSGSLTDPGFHTLTLTTPAEITTGQRFSVVLYLGGTSLYPQAIEYVYPGWSSAATADVGETYYSFSGVFFRDLANWDPTANFCLKAYAGQKLPVADAGGPYVGNAISWAGARVSLNGLDSYGGMLTYEWDLNLAWDSDSDGNPSNDVDETRSTADYLFATGQTDIALVARDEHGLASLPDITSVMVTEIEVAIDIKPGSHPNCINMGSHGVIPVAFLTDETFDASTIDPLTVTLRGEGFVDGLVELRGKKNVKPAATLKDVDGDGDLDLLVKLNTEKLFDYEIDAECTLGALTFDGYVVSGSDTIRVVPVK